MAKKNVVVIGGGTGTYVTLSGLKKYPKLNLTVIISMMDSGGSNRILRDEFGLLPTSDIRQAIVALSSDKTAPILRKLFTYRYENGIGISGMTFGNLFMAALTDIFKSQSQAIAETCKLLGVSGQIIPVTNELAHLVARYSNGKQVLGEHQIDEPGPTLGQHRIVELEVFPQVSANPDALEAIYKADYIILGPGDLYTSTLCNVVVPGIAPAIAASKAKIIYVVNLMTKFGQTHELSAQDHVAQIDKYLGRSPDHIVTNKHSPLAPEILARYSQEQSQPVIDDLGPQAIRANLLSTQIYAKPKSDILHRSLIRHDAAKLASTLTKIMV